MYYIRHKCHIVIVLKSYLRSTRDTCSQFCMAKGENCTAFYNNDETRKCEIGHLSGNEIIDYEGGLEIHAKTGNATVRESFEDVFWARQIKSLLLF